MARLSPLSQFLIFSSITLQQLFSWNASHILYRVCELLLKWGIVVFCLHLKMCMLAKLVDCIWILASIHLGSVCQMLSSMYWCLWWTWIRKKVHQFHFIASFLGEVVWLLMEIGLSLISLDTNKMVLNWKLWRLYS